MLNLNDLVFFARAAEAGGFAAAARQLGCPKSTVSKRVAELEARIGARLVNRSSHSFVLTDVGREVFEHARAAMIEAEAAEYAVLRRRAEPVGTVRITASVPTAQAQLAPRLPLLAASYPRLMIELHVTDRFVDLMQESFDIAVRSHFAPLPSSELVGRLIRSEPIVLVASPAYFDRQGIPRTPEDLAAHHGLWTRKDGPPWRLSRPDADSVDVTPQPRFVADESVVLLEAAKAGLGIAALPRSMVEAAIAEGQLAQALAPWTAGAVSTTLLTTHRRHQLPAVRAVIDFLAQG